MPVTKPGEPQVSDEQFKELKVAINKLNNQMTGLAKKIESVETQVDKKEIKDDITPEKCPDVPEPGIKPEPAPKKDDEKKAPVEGSPPKIEAPPTKAEPTKAEPTTTAASTSTDKPPSASKDPSSAASIATIAAKGPSDILAKPAAAPSTPPTDAKPSTAAASSSTKDKPEANTTAASTKKA